MTPRSTDSRPGMAAGAIAYTIWGLFPLYLKALGGVTPIEVLAHRIVWSALLMAAVVILARHVRHVRTLPVRTWLMLVGSALCIGTNWLLYIAAAMGNHTLDASLGYFILPLISVLFGTVLLRDRLTARQWAAVALAALGVVITTAARGALPLLSLGLAFSFACYGLIRNRAAVDPLSGLFVETMILAPAAALYLSRHGSFLGHDRPVELLLMGTAVITAVPLLLFGWAARRLTLSTIGILQYLSPTIVFLLAVFRYHEPLGSIQLAAFGLIWAGVALYLYDGWRRRRLAR